MNFFENIIVGSGPSGLMCAAKLASKSTLILEKNGRIGGKIKVSGGGRCNVTNNKENEQLMNYIVRNAKFLYPSLNHFASKDIIKFFEDNNCPLKEEDNNRVFPKDNLSTSIINTFERVLEKQGKQVYTNYTVRTITQNEDGLYLINDELTCRNLIIATGGQTYQHLGTTGDGYEFAKQFGHSIVELEPCETPLVSNDALIQGKELQGISLQNVKATLFVNGKKKKTLQQDILFTHFGLSGPLALHLSYDVNEGLKKKKPVKIRLDLNSCIVPKKMRAIISEDYVDIDLHGIRGWNVAFVTKGGIKLKEINPNNFESKLNPNLHFIGEVLDINANTGGYNISLCLSEGATCAHAINQNM